MDEMILYLSVTNFKPEI